MVVELSTENFMFVICQEGQCCLLCVCVFGLGVNVYKLFFYKSAVELVDV